MTRARIDTARGIPAPRLPAPIGCGVYSFIQRPTKPVAAPIVPQRIIVITEEPK